jgi:hypothetical protein
MSEPFATQETLFGLLQRPQWHGQYFSALCPFHIDKNPSLLVFPDHGQCLAVTCRRRASLKQIYDKVMGHRPRDYEEPKSVSVIAWKSMPDADTLATEGHEILSSNPSLGHYLHQRGIEDRIDPQMLGWWMGWYVVPVLNSKYQVTGIMLRSTTEMQKCTGIRWIGPPEQHCLLYVPDYPLIQRRKRVYVVFGMMDALVLTSLRLPAVTATNIPGFESEMLDEFRMPIYVIPDKYEDDKGRELVNDLGWRGHLVQLPYTEDLKDPADYAKVGKKADLLRLLC